MGLPSSRQPRRHSGAGQNPKGRGQGVRQVAGLCLSLRCHSGAGPPAWMHAYRDVGGRAASGTSRRGGRAASGTRAEESSGLIIHSRIAGMPIHRRHNRTRHPAKSAILHSSTAPSWIPALKDQACQSRAGLRRHSIQKHLQQVVQIAPAGGGGADHAVVHA